MDKREERKLEEEKDKKARKLDKELKALDVQYTRAKRKSDRLMDDAHHYYLGESADFMKILDKNNQNLLKFERELEKQRRSLEEEKRKLQKDFDRVRRGR